MRCIEHHIIEVIQTIQINIKNIQTTPSTGTLLGLICGAHCAPYNWRLGTRKCGMTKQHKGLDMTKNKWYLFKNLIWYFIWNTITPNTCKFQNKFHGSGATICFLRWQLSACYMLFTLLWYGLHISRENGTHLTQINHVLISYGLVNNFNISRFLDFSCQSSLICSHIYYQPNPCTQVYS